MSFEGEVDGASDGPGAVDGARRDDDALQRSEDGFGPACEFDVEFAGDDEEKFVGSGMVVPAVFAFEHGEAQAFAVGVEQHAVAVRLVDGAFQGVEIDDLQRSEPRTFGSVFLGGGHTGFHVTPGEWGALARNSVNR